MSAVDSDQSSLSHNNDNNKCAGSLSTAGLLPHAYMHALADTLKWDTHIFTAVNK